MMRLSSLAGWGMGYRADISASARVGLVKCQPGSSRARLAPEAKAREAPQSKDRNHTNQPISRKRWPYGRVMHYMSAGGQYSRNKILCERSRSARRDATSSPCQIVLIRHVRSSECRMRETDARRCLLGPASPGHRIRCDPEKPRLVELAISKIPKASVGGCKDKTWRRSTTAYRQYDSVYLTAVPIRAPIRAPIRSRCTWYGGLVRLLGMRIGDRSVDTVINY